MGRCAIDCSHKRAKPRGGYREPTTSRALCTAVEIVDPPTSQGVLRHVAGRAETYASRAFVYATMCRKLQHAGARQARTGGRQARDDQLSLIEHRVGIALSSLSSCRRQLASPCDRVSAHRRPCDVGCARACSLNNSDTARSASSSDASTQTISDSVSISASRASQQRRLCDVLSDDAICGASACTGASRDAGGTSSSARSACRTRRSALRPERAPWQDQDRRSCERVGSLCGPFVFVRRRRRARDVGAVRVRGEIAPARAGMNPQAEATSGDRSDLPYRVTAISGYAGPLCDRLR